MREYDNILMKKGAASPPLVPGEVLAALVEMHNIAPFLQHLSKMITLPACGDIPFALRLTVLDGLDGVMNYDVAQVGAASKGIYANLFQPFGNVDRLQGVEILERMVLDFLNIVRENDAHGVLTGRSDGNPVLSDLHTVSNLNTIPEKFHTILCNC